MGLNDTPSANRIHITFFGKRNAGKSSVVNAITNQKLSLVSHIAGTTTDPVSKSMELGDMGPVVITDTAGIDDVGTLGDMRVSKTLDTLKKTHIAVLVTDTMSGMTDYDTELIRLFDEKKIPYIVVYNKIDLADCPDGMLGVSAKTGENIEVLKKKITEFKPSGPTNRLVADFIHKGSKVLFVTPIDESAPKGRLILPQQQAIRDVLDIGGISVVVQPQEVEEAINILAPDLVVTDSQVFGLVDALVPKEIPLTSFSILMARVKGLLESAVSGAEALDNLKDGDKVLICEGCTHHRQCKDIGTVLLPRLIRNHSKANPDFEFTSGGHFPHHVKKYALIVHCGGCMLNEKEMESRVSLAAEQGVPITNYGTAIAHMKGILKRSLEIIYR